MNIHAALLALSAPVIATSRSVVSPNGGNFANLLAQIRQPNDPDAPIAFAAAGVMTPLAPTLFDNTHLTPAEANARRSPPLPPLSACAKPEARAAATEQPTVGAYPGTGLQPALPTAKGYPSSSKPSRAEPVPSAPLSIAPQGDSARVHAQTNAAGPRVTSTTSIKAMAVLANARTSAVSVAICATEAGLRIHARVGRMAPTEAARLRHDVETLLAAHGETCAGLELAAPWGGGSWPSQR